MGRLFQLAYTYFRIGAMNELQYRVNLIIQAFQSILALITGLVGLGLVFNHTSELGGWTAPDLLVVMGIYLIMGGLIRMTIQPNMERLMGDIQMGSLDYALTKPADSQVMVSVREVRIWQAVDLITGGIVLAIAMARLETKLGLSQALVFPLTLLMGGVMIYCFWLIITTGAFWLVRMDQVVELFQGIYQAGRWPVDVYPGWLRMTLTFLVPIAFAVTVPAQSLTGRLTWQVLLGAGGLTIFLLVLSRWFWKIGLRNYSGASS